MNVYLDTSAIVPLLMNEPTTASCTSIWNKADVRLTTRLLFVEATSALGRARQVSGVGASQVAAGLDQLENSWPQLQVLELDDQMMRSAASMSLRFGLRGYDAIHCAAAFQLADPDFVAASGDRKLIEAWRQLGVQTFQPTG